MLPVQINTTSEILRRLLYVICLLGYAATLLLLTAGCALHDWRLLSATGVCALFTCLLRCLGYRFLQFTRMTNSFPMGCLADQVPQWLRHEITGLVQEFHHPETDWTRRQEIRNQVQTYIVEHPIAVKAYYGELRQLLPGIMVSKD